MCDVENVVEAQERQEREKLTAIIATQAQELQRLRALAKRYLVLRNHTLDGMGDVDDRFYVACDDSIFPNRWALYGAELDNAVDAWVQGFEPEDTAALKAALQPKEPT